MQSFKVPSPDDIVIEDDFDIGYAPSAPATPARVITKVPNANDIDIDGDFRTGGMEVAPPATANTVAPTQLNNRPHTNQVKTATADESSTATDSKPSSKGSQKHQFRATAARRRLSGRMREQTYAEAHTSAADDEVTVESTTLHRSGQHDPEQLRALRLREVIRVTGMSRSAIYSAIARGEFPRQIRLSQRCVGWYARAISAWLQSRQPAV